MNKKKIQRLSDNKYLISLENDTWTDKIEDATEFGFKQLNETRKKLLLTYKSKDIIEVEA